MSEKHGKSALTSNVSEATPEITAEWVKGADLYRGEVLVRRGRPRLKNARKLLSLRVPPDIIDRWKASGPGWQTRMAEVLEQHAPSPHCLPEPKPERHIGGAVTSTRNVLATGPARIAALSKT
jgi:uncharacterized protein (DUF4415 family)